MSAFDPIDPKLFDAPSPELAKSPDGHGGYTARMEAEDTIDAVRSACGVTSRKFPKALWREPREWWEVAHECDLNKTWPVNYVDRFTNQDPTHECTCHSLRTNFEAARNRGLGIIYPDGPKKDFRYDESKRGSVWVSPLSVYAEANPQQWGGANVLQVVNIAANRGLLPDKIQPFEYGFKHTLQGTTGRGGKNQSSGSWVSVSRFPDDWRETAKWLRPLEIIVPESFEESVCMILAGIVDSVGRDGHAVPYTKLRFDGKELIGAEYIDSYDVVRYDSVRTMRRAWEGSFGIATVTMPDDFMNPAGMAA